MRLIFDTLRLFMFKLGLYMKNLIILLPLLLLQSCGPIAEDRPYIVENKKYDSPLKPCAYSYPDLEGNLCVVEITDKNVLPSFPGMDSNEIVRTVSKMAMEKQCQRTGGKKVAEEIIDNDLLQICQIPGGLDNGEDCFKGILNCLIENRFVCLCYHTPASGKETIKPKILAMKDRLLSNYECYRSNAGQLASEIPGKQFNDEDGNLYVIEQQDEHYYPTPPTCTREEYVSYLLNMLADIQCEKKLGSKKVYTEMTDEGCFVVLELPKGLNNTEDCTKGVLTFNKEGNIYHICYLVPAEKKASKEMLKSKLIEMKRTL